MDDGSIDRSSSGHEYDVDRDCRFVILRLLRSLHRPGKRRRSVRRSYLPRRLTQRSAVDAYRLSCWPDRRSSFAHEIIRIPAYEDRARRGQRAPHRFEWRGQWHRVVDVGAIWADDRKNHSQRTYYAASTERGDIVQLYYESQGKEGCWKIYRRVSIRPTSGSSAGSR